MSNKVIKKLKNQRKRQFINNNFDDFRKELLDYANTYYSKQIQDFSESSLGGMLLDFAAVIGDSLAFYSEQQFNELNYETATNTENLSRYVRQAGIKTGTVSPSSVNVEFFIEVDSLNNSPVKEQLPVIRKGTIVTSDSGINFSLSEDVDFSKNTKKEVLEENTDGTPLSYIVSKEGLCISGDIVTESTTFSDIDGFLSYTLENSDVTKIIKISDEDLNDYYEVDFLSQDTIYKKVEFSNDSYFEIFPAPFRFIREVNFGTGLTTLRFGNGDGKFLKDNFLTNPEDLLLPLLDSDYTNKQGLDPNKLLKSNTLGVSPRGKEVFIRYRHGGGDSHNVSLGSITNKTEINISFPYDSNDTVTDSKKEDIINSIAVFNNEEAIGGTPGQTLNELKLQIPNAMKSQSRIITHQDLIARIYSMPSDFGRVNKIAALDSPYTRTVKDLFIICKNSEGFYVPASDAIKLNISKYINEFRLIGDSFNILDVPVYNFGLRIKVKIGAGYNIESVISNISFRIVENMRFDNLQIGEAINTNDIINVLLNTEGVISIESSKEEIIQPKSSTDAFLDVISEEILTYNETSFSPLSSYENGFVYPPRGGIFEMRYSARDIVIEVI
tara:strand:+ start:286 stop:2121 length:1836 start_codon:yes stop_codon:yes gene_type:complete